MLNLPRHISLLRIVAPLGALLMLHLYIRQKQSRYLMQDVHSPVEILIPRTVHQLLISMPRHPVSSSKPSSHTMSWQRSGWKVEYWSEDSCLQLAQELDSTNLRSKTFQQLSTAVLRSDFCRYLVMFARGGLYNDLDVHLMKPLPWGVMGPSTKEASGPPALIIGLEGDTSTKGLSRSPQFVQWTMASIPSHPIFHDVLDRIQDSTPSYLQQAAEPGVELDIMGWTGPGVWTDAVMAYLNCTVEQIHTLRDLKESVRIKDILILPKRSFAVVQGEDHTAPDILVKHYFTGTWKHSKDTWIDRINPWSR